MTHPELPIAQQHHLAGRLREAEEIYRRILEEDPDDPHTLYLLGQLLHQSGRAKEAIERLSAAVHSQPNFPEAHHQLGVALHGSGDVPGAMASYRRALAQRPQYALAMNSIGIAHQSLGEYQLAIESFRAALKMQSDLGVAMSNLGAMLSAGGDNDEAIRLLTRAAELQPTLPGTRNNLGTALQQAGRLDEAIASFTEAIKLRPDFADAYNNLGSALKYSAQWTLAPAYYRRAVQLQPTRVAWHSNLIAALNYAPLESPEILRKELDAWNCRHAEPLKGEIHPHDNDRGPDRRIKIGYISPDFRGHPIGRFLQPLLAHHDHQRFEVVCYSDVVWPDDTTRRLQSYADLWRESRSLPDPKLAEMIRQDRIDILVDLSLHTAGNRLLVFARKPAPIQVSYLGYCGTTGMTAVDYRLTDPYLDPLGADESAYSERSVRLPRTYWCYQPLDTLEPGPLPAETTGAICFASFNNFCKTSPAVWEVWTRVLQAVPGSRLVVASPFGSHRQRFRQVLVAAGVNPDRLSFAPIVSPREYFQNYQRVDIALDPFPYGGGTTTCDALWMGVPVITLRGSTAVGRAGASILSNAGLPELIAGTVEDFIAIAKQLAEDIPRLSRLRRDLRPQLRQSPLMDAAGFARDVEEAFRRMWIDWCKGESHG